MTYQEWAKAVAECDHEIEDIRAALLRDLIELGRRQSGALRALCYVPEQDTAALRQYQGLDDANFYLVLYTRGLPALGTELQKLGAELEAADKRRAALLVTEYDEPEDEAATAVAELNAIEVKP